MWGIHLILRNASVVDIGWGLGFILLSVDYIMLGQGFNLRNSICFLMVFLWGMRIVLYLIKRIASDNEEDKRYKKIRQDFGKMAWLKFLLIFEFQAGLEMIIGVPFIIVSLNPVPGISLWEVLGTIVFTVALIGETIADEQLHAYKKDPAHKGKTCDAGLWSYSRHPNYFFEWLVWVGLFVYALGSPMGWVAVISPLAMFYLLMFVSGIPMAEEQSLKSRGDEYRRYQAVTSVFFPMLKRKLKT
jgi:steroid 5-alpha reductase family enzyme